MFGFRIETGLTVSCLTNKFNDLLVFFAPGCVTPPRVGPTTTRRRQPLGGWLAVCNANCYRALTGAPLPGTKNPAHFIKFICETGH